MKKFTRVLTMALVLVMLCSLLPVGALAESVFVFEQIYARADWGFDSFLQPIKDYTIAVTDKAQSLSPDKYIVREDGDYDLVGIITQPLPAPPIPPMDSPTDEEMEAFDKEYKAWADAMNKWWETAKVGNGIKSLNIPPFPENGTIEQMHNWYYQYSTIVVAYAPHVHKYSRWYSDSTNHWRSCLVCKDTFLLMDWHKDEDGDKKCDSCEAEIVYYDITIEEVEGAKLVELEGDLDMTAAYRDQLTVEFEAEEGYRLLGVRFYKVRDDGTESELTRKVITKYEVYGVEMPSFNIRIVPEVVKAD